MPAGVEVGATVWVACRNEVWRAGDVVGFGDAPKSTGGGQCAIVDVQDESGKAERVEVPLQTVKGVAKILLRSEDLKDRLSVAAGSDLSQLPLLHEPAVLHTLQVRFEAGHVYTLSGPVLLAVNPFREVPGLYGHATLASYVDPKGEETKAPHVFSVGRATYQGIRLRAARQTVLVSGESGAGKTETTKFVMRFLALAGAGGTEASMSTVERQVLSSIPVLEALGNAKTLRNDNSSRFGKYIELQFGLGLAGSSAPRLVGARTHTYLLEKVRVTGQQEGERSFHIFYQAIAATEAAQTSEANAADRIELRGAKGLRAADFAYLRRSISCAGSDHEDAQAFRETVAALKAFGVEGAELSGLLDALMAVLHLGNVDFAAPKNNSEGSEPVRGGSAGDSLQRACELLQVGPEALSAAWCRRTMKAPGEGVISTPLTVAKAVEGRDALARHLYGAIFTFVVARINAAVAADGDGASNGANSPNAKAKAAQLPFVGVLDIFGFEFFDMNSLEQLFINYTNELLQQYFNEVIFEHEADLYAREGIKWNPLDFPDNRLIVDLIGKVSTGVLPMLDEECMVVGGNADQWCLKLQRTHGSRSQFGVVKHRQGNFIIQHFAGPVEYASQQFLEKNRDQLGADIVTCMKGSKSEFVSQRFFEHDRSFGTQESVNAQSGNRRVSRARVYTVSSEFRGQLQNLMERIRATEPHFIRCIKPNPQSVPWKFNRRSVVQQLQYQGVLQAIEVSRAGFPMRLSHRQAVLDFRCIAPLDCRVDVEAQIARREFREAAQVLFSALGSMAGLADGTWASGSTLVFLKREAIEALSGSLTSCRRNAAVRAQSFWRRHVLRKRFLMTVRAVMRLQATGRGLAARRLTVILRRVRAAVRMQSVERARRAKVLRRRRLLAINILQVWFRVRKLRHRFLMLRISTVKLQGWWRVTRARLQAKQRRRSAVRLQSAWRGHRGRRRALLLRAAAGRRTFVVRRLVRSWREKVRWRLLGVSPLSSSASDADYSWPTAAPQDDAQGTELTAPRCVPLEQRLEAASVGELAAAVAAMKLALASKKKQAASLRLQRETLQMEADELASWTLSGMARGLAVKVFGTDCAESTCWRR